MSTRSSGKTEVEYWQWIWREYRNEFPGDFCQDDVVEWALAKGWLDLPRVDPKKLLVKKAKQAARSARIEDRQGRMVREYLPAKVPLEVDENGNILLFDVRYDHIHTMSLDHALLVFDQRDENIKKQQRSATRDLESFLDNNPNAVGRQQLFVFDFSREEVGQQAVQKIEESGVPPKG